MDNIPDEITKLREENAKQKQIIQDLETRLKKYTNNQGHKKYLEQHKEQIQTIKNNYLQKLKEENPEKLKEYWRRASQKRKEKKLQEQPIQEKN
jgi:septum formation inhibitor MinC